MPFLDQMDHLPRLAPRGTTGGSRGGLSVPSDVLEDEIRSGEGMHPAVVSLAMRGYSREQLEALLNESVAKTERPDRWREIVDNDLPRALKSAAAKRSRHIAATLATIPPPPKPVASSPVAELPLIGPGDFAARPLRNRKWVVSPIIPKGETTLLYGPGATGKSLLLLQLAVSVAAWKVWLGRPVSMGRVLFFTCEDDADEINRRAAKVLKAYGIDWSALGDRLAVIPMRGTEASAVLANAGRDGTLVTTPTYAALKRTIERFQPDLVIVDTLADVFAGNENDRGHAKQFIKLIEQLVTFGFWGLFQHTRPRTPFREGLAIWLELFKDCLRTDF